MRLIDADAVEPAIVKWIDDADDIRHRQQVIDDIPTIDAEPVRHGKWIRVDNTFTAWKCSECGAIERHNCFDYCHCGAKMDRKEERP